MASKLLSGIVSAFLPNYCQLCGCCSAKTVCEFCLPSLTRNDHACRCCSEPFGPIYGAATQHLEGGLLCNACLKHSPSFDASTCAFLYQGQVAHLIRQFKRKNDNIGRFLSQSLLEKLEGSKHDSSDFDLIVPVPMHWTHRLQRGFHPASFIASFLSTKLKVPMSHSLYISKKVSKQKTLTRKQRLKNLENAYFIRNSLSGLRVAIVDDVMTTGATAEAVAKACVNAGAARVVIFALARTPKTHS